MPARQRGFARRRGPNWLAVWRENGNERSRGGFETKTEALDYANAKAEQSLDLAAAVRFGDPLPQQQPSVGTVHGTRRCVPRPPPRRRGDLADAAFSTQARNGRVRRAPAPRRCSRSNSTFGARSYRRSSAHYIFRAFRQVLEYAVAMGLVEQNPTARIRNTRAATRNEQRPVRELGADRRNQRPRLDPRFTAIPTVLVGTGLRPEELFALERRDLDLDAGVLSVERVYTQRVLKEPNKSSSRNVGAYRCAHASSRRSKRFRRGSTTPLLFPAARGGYIDLEKFRYRAVDARASGRGDRAPARLRLPPHVRVLGDRRRRPALLSGADHGDERGADRRHLRASAARLGGLPARSARRLRRRLRTERGLGERLSDEKSLLSPGICG